MSVEIWHNPRCSKSRQTLELLRQQGVEPVIVEYLSATPTADRIGEVLDMLAIEPRELMRRKEEAYKSEGLDDTGLTNEQLIAAMVDHPKLIERPVVINGKRAAVGRPPEEVLKIL